MTITATSNAPKVGSRKRRLSQDDDEDSLKTEQSVKKAKAEIPADPEPRSSPTPEVKEVTKAVKDVDLGSVDDKSTALPETIPLPEDDSAELEDSSSISSTPPPATDHTSHELPAESSADDHSAAETKELEQVQITPTADDEASTDALTSTSSEDEKPPLADAQEVEQD